MKCGGIYKVIVIGFLMCLLCSQGFAGNGKGPGNGLKEAIESAVRAAKKDSKGLFKDAEAKLAKMINIIEKASRLRPNSGTEYLRNLQTLLFWNRIFHKSMQHKAPEVKTVENNGDHVTEPIENGQDPPVITETKPEISAEETLKRLKKLFKAVLNAYQAGKEPEADEFMERFFKGDIKESMPNSASLVKWYVQDKEKALFKLYREIGNMKGKKVFYTPPRTSRFLQGEIVDIREDKVQIRSGSMTIGVPVLSLAPAVLAEAGLKLETKDRILLGFFLHLKSHDTIGKAICPKLKEESELNKLFVMLRQIINLRKQRNFLKQFLGMIAKAEDHLAKHEYTKSFSEFMQISVLNDDQLKILNEDYSLTSNRTLASILTAIMKTCDNCRGNYKMVCPKCKGSGKVLEDDKTTFFETGKISMKLVKCNRCGGTGTALCLKCSKRRFDKEGLKFQKRLQELLLDKPEPKGGNNDRSGKDHPEQR